MAFVSCSALLSGRIGINHSRHRCGLYQKPYKHKVNIYPCLLTLSLPCFIISPHSRQGDVLELADRHDLGSCAARRVGSSPTVPTILETLNGLHGEQS